MKDRAYSEAIGQALLFAAEAHAEQRRKGKPEPYLSHVLAVTALVAHHGGDETQIIAAALHDAAEDQGGEEILAEITARFGDPVAHIVRECSDVLASAGAVKPDWWTRKRSHLEHIAQRGDSAATLVEACDKLANLADIVEDLGIHGETFLDRFAGGPDGVRWYYQELDRVLIPQVPQLQPRYQELLRILLQRPATVIAP